METSFSFLPGPVEIIPEVQQALQRKPFSHRSQEFKDIHKEVRESLCALTNADTVEIFVGTGTLANEVVATHLWALDKKGLILSNGEFGDRLVDHAERLSINCEVLHWPSAFGYNDIENFLKHNKKIGWLWCTHCETSSGILNSIDTLKDLCKKYNILLCLDCISSVGVVPVDLTNIYLSTCASGKGLSAYPGLALVFSNELYEPIKKIPRYLDINYYKKTQGIPFTSSSNLLLALQAALKYQDYNKRFQVFQQFSHKIRDELEKLGFEIIGDNSNTNPSVITICIPKHISSKKMGDQIKQEGFCISYESRYLIESNTFQICLMGNISMKNVESLLEKIKKINVTLQK